MIVDIPAQDARDGCGDDPAKPSHPTARARVRIFRLHHVTFNINSLCHYFCRRPFATGDQPRNLAALAFGEAWHNNHHAFPTSALHGLRRCELDPGGWLIGALKRCHLAWDVIRITPGRQLAKRCSPGA